MIAETEPGCARSHGHGSGSAITSAGGDHQRHRGQLSHAATRSSSELTEQ